MDEKPKSIWKKSWPSPRWLRAWLIVVAATFFTVLIVTLFIPGRPRSLSDWWPVLVFMLLVSVVVATVFVGLLTFIRCFFCWRNFKRLLFGSACLATLIALFYAEEDWRGKYAWEKFKREWEAKGEKFNYASFIPPPVPDEQNFALTPIWIESMKARLGPQNSRQWFGNNFAENGRTNFTDRLQMEIYHTQGWSQSRMEKIQVGDRQKTEMTDLKLWQNYYRSPSDGVSPDVLTNDFPVAPQLQSPAQDVLVALSKYDSAIEELRQASQLPYSRFPIEYDKNDPAAILLPHLGALKRCSEFLQLRAIAKLQNGQSEKALDDVNLSLRLTDSVRNEPILISHLVRIAIVNIALQPVWEGLAEHKWSDAQLAALDAELAKLDFLADYELCQHGELGFLPKALEYRRRTRNPEYFYYSEYDNNQKHPLEVELAVFIYRHCPGGWFYQNQLRYCRFALQNYLPMLDASRQLAFPASAKRANDAQLKEVAHLNPYNFIEYKLLFPPFDFLARSGLAEKFTHAQSSVDLARVGIALERYRLAHGEYPESLDALAPQFMKKIPHDIINGQPLHYRRTAGSQFVLYSVGWNETDDGGEVVLRSGSTPGVDLEKGDWVWRYPAT